MILDLRRFQIGHSAFQRLFHVNCLSLTPKAPTRELTRLPRTSRGVISLVGINNEGCWFLSNTAFIVQGILLILRLTLSKI